MKDLTLNGTLGSLEVHVKGPPQRGPIDIIVVITIIEILEFFIFFFMIQTSWTTFVAHNRKSIFRFLTSLSALKKVRTFFLRLQCCYTFNIWLEPKRTIKYRLRMNVI